MILDKKLDKFKNRISAFKKLRGLLKIFKGSKLVLKQTDDLPDWILVDKYNKEIASISSNYVSGLGVYNHFYKGFNP